MGKAACARKYDGERSTLAYTTLHLARLRMIRAISLADLTKSAHKNRDKVHDSVGDMVETDFF